MLLVYFFAAKTMASYSYSLTEVNEMCHFVMPNEKDYGMQNTILRNCGTVREPFKVHAHIVNQMFKEKEPRDVVFMQVTGPGKAFEPYDKEKYKLPITLKAYIELLKFFANDYQMLLNRIDADNHVMSTGKEWLSLTPAISFKGPADITYKKTLEKGCSFDLEIQVVRRVDLSKTSVTLKYSKEDLGMMYIHPPALLHLAKDRTYISSLVSYKGGSTPKRSRQS